jgi:hypothetical protein
MFPFINFLAKKEQVDSTMIEAHAGTIASVLQID